MNHGQQTMVGGGAASARVLGRVEASAAAYGAQAAREIYRNQAGSIVATAEWLEAVIANAYEDGAKATL